jgi:hypothetical protein
MEWEIFIKTYLSFTTSVISSTGGRVKFISKIDVFMCSPSKPIYIQYTGTSKCSTAYPLPPQSSQPLAAGWSSYQRLMFSLQSPNHNFRKSHLNSMCAKCLKTHSAYPSSPQSSPPLAAVQSSCQIWMFSCVLLAIVINSHSAIQYLLIREP